MATGEQPLAWQTVDLAWGESRIGRTEPPKAVHGINLDPLAVVSGDLVDVDSGLFERWLGGISLCGHAGSVADHLGVALERARMGRLAVTTKRLVLFTEGSTTFGTDATGKKTWDTETEEVLSIPRAWVRRARRRSRPFMVGRLVIDFVDDSSAALMCGVVSPIAANRLRDALLT
ncbi:hypothetical protein ASG90_13745 [Nocardioides sp. Soil797]|nr:hypothetical protein ASG90_13745 [Nocardioides sp. Soil797]